MNTPVCRGLGVAPSLFMLPRIIDGAGAYRTRDGNIVMIFEKRPHGQWCWQGRYQTPPKVVDSWHATGRLYSGVECVNDIVAKV